MINDKQAAALHKYLSYGNVDTLDVCELMVEQGWLGYNEAQDLFALLRAAYMRDDR